MSIIVCILYLFLLFLFNSSPYILKSPTSALTVAEQMDFTKWYDAASQHKKKGNKK